MYLSLSLQPTPALIGPDTAAAHHGNGALDQIPTARARASTIVITVMIHGSNGGGGVGATARAQWEILTFGPQWSGGLVHGPMYLVCAAREADVRLSSLTEKIRLV